MMALTSKQIYVNLHVKDLKRTKEFFASMGFNFNEQFTNDKAACMVVSEHIYAMLLVEDFFKSFTRKEIVDTSNSSEVMLALTAESKEKVDEIVNRALTAGGTSYMDPTDHGFMYEWGFQDIDGHHWSVFYMDPAAVNG